MKISSVLGVLALLVVLGVSQIAQAQSFGIRIGGGGGNSGFYFGSGGSGYYPGGYGYPGGYRGYGPGYGYPYGSSGLGIQIAPRGSYQQQGYYSQPQQQYYYPAPVQAVEPPYTGPGIVIGFADPGESASIQYRLDDKWDFTMKPGEKQKLPEKASRIIEFDRGGEFGTARYTITEGYYDFHLTPKGWDIWKLPSAPVITTKPADDGKLPGNPIPGQPATGAKEL